MLRANPKKTKSALNSSRLFWVWVAWAVAAAVFVLIVVIAPRTINGENKAVLRQPQQNTRSMVLNARTYTLEVVTSREDQERGLGRRASLPTDHGMLFDFGSEAERCIWMQDMKFPLDIIWADNDKVVTSVESNVSPSSYPATYCSNARYVIELNAGVLSNRTETTVRKGLHLSIR